MTDRVLRFEDFEDKIGQSFTLTEPGVSDVALTLREAELLRRQQLPPGGRPAFSLIFIDRADRILPQRLYHLEHDALGAIRLFLVPVGKDQNGVSYQALFN